MNIFIDTAVKGCNIALFDEQNILVKGNKNIERGHAETILPLFEDLMRQINKSTEDIDNIYVTIGPGSFTGLRVGLTVARFIAFSLSKPVHGITTFQAFSCGIKDQKDRIVLIETKRSDFYYQRLNDHHEPISAAQSLKTEDIAKTILDTDKTILTGDAVTRFLIEINQKDFNFMEQASINIDSVISAIQNKSIKMNKAEALYVRDADVTIQR
jgi:tRNA threonylcarbamoyladenosine biosynthesis protein TsaB